MTQQQVKHFPVTLTLLPDNPSLNFSFNMAENTRHRVQRMTRWALTSCPVAHWCEEQKGNIAKCYSQGSTIANSTDNIMSIAMVVEALFIMSWSKQHQIWPAIRSCFFSFLFFFYWSWQWTNDFLVHRTSIVIRHPSENCVAIMRNPSSRPWEL